VKVEDAGELRSFDLPPKEREFFMTAVRYSNDWWSNGPSGYSKEEVIKSLQSFSGITDARIYTVRLPVKLPGE
jgi:hypothetical protein